MRVLLGLCLAVFFAGNANAAQFRIDVAGSIDSVTEGFTPALTADGGTLVGSSFSAEFIYDTAGDSDLYSYSFLIDGFSRVSLSFPRLQIRDNLISTFTSSDQLSLLGQNGLEYQLLVNGRDLVNAGDEDDLTRIQSDDLADLPGVDIGGFSQYTIQFSYLFTSDSQFGRCDTSSSIGACYILGSVSSMSQSEIIVDDPDISAVPLPASTLLLLTAFGLLSFTGSLRRS